MKKMRKKIISHKYKILIPYHILQLLLICSCDDYIFIIDFISMSYCFCVIRFFSSPFSPIFLSPNHISFTLKSKHPLNDGDGRDEMMLLRND